MTDSLKSRVFWTDRSAWNNPWYVYAGAPLLAAIGATGGSLWSGHLVSGEIPTALVVGTCILATMLVGFTVLAAVDRRHATGS